MASRRMRMDWILPIYSGQVGGWVSFFLLYELIEEEQAVGLRCCGFSVGGWVGGWVGGPTDLGEGLKELGFSGGRSEVTHIQGGRTHVPVHGGTRAGTAAATRGLWRRGWVGGRVVGWVGGLDSRRHIAPSSISLLSPPSSSSSKQRTAAPWGPPCPPPFIVPAWLALAAAASIFF